MATFPTGLPVFPVHSAKNEYPKVGDRNNPNREIEAICSDLGVNPRSISDSVAPGASPSTVAAYLDMIANILKTFHGGSTWYGGPNVIKRIIGGNGVGNTVGISSTSYLRVMRGNLDTTDAAARAFVGYDAELLALKVNILSAQPAGGNLVFTFMVLGVADSGIQLTVASTDGTGVKSATGSVVLHRGEMISLRAQNFNTGNVSSQIGGWTAYMRQKGF